VRIFTTALLAALLSLGCAGMIVRGPDYTALVAEWFRSGCYVVAPGGAAMETHPMSPVLGGALAGGAAAGAGGAAAGGGTGFLTEVVKLFTGADGRMYECGLLEATRRGE
jgi:hypothetical protein